MNKYYKRGSIVVVVVSLLGLVFLASYVLAADYVAYKGVSFDLTLKQHLQKSKHPSWAVKANPSLKDEQLVCSKKPEDMPNGLLGDVDCNAVRAGADSFVAWDVFEDGNISANSSNPSYPFVLSDEQCEVFASLSLPWKFKLYDMLRSIDDATRASIFATLSSLSPDEQNLADEILFVYAFSSKEELMGNPFDRIPALNADLVVKNARDVYSIAESLPYASLVEKDDGTTSLVLDGKELPWWVYYMFVVHPRQDAETICFVDPSSDECAESGDWWRTEFLYGNHFWGAYPVHFLLENPNRIENLLDFGECSAAVVSSDVDPLHVIDAYEGGPGCVAEMNPSKGRVVVSTIGAMEACAQNAKCDLYENLLLYGRGDVLLDSSEPILIIKGSAVPESFDVCKVANDAGYNGCSSGGAERINEQALGYFKKLVVLADSDASLIDVLKQNEEMIANFVNSGGVLWISAHGLDAGTSLVMGVSLSALDSASSPVAGSHPILSQILANATGVWNGESYHTSGKLPLGPSYSALDAIGYFVSQNMWHSVSSRREAGGRIERAQHSIRIARNHYGNCGELQDMGTAAGRSALVPFANTSDSAEDHVWSEFASDCTDNACNWAPFQTSWADSEFVVADPANAMDSTHGGGKEVSAIYTWRGDGEMFLRTSTYTDTITFKVSVKDSKGTPVQGALVLIATENYYDHSQLVITFYDYTDSNGEAIFELGDNRNYYVQIDGGSLGVFPGERQVSQAIKAEDASAGESFVLDHQFDSELPYTKVSVVGAGGGSDSDEPITIHARAVMELKNLFTGFTFLRPYDDMSVYLLDDDNFAKYQQGETFEASAEYPIDPQTHTANLPLPNAGLHIVVLPKIRYENLHFYAWIEYEAAVDGDMDSAEEDANAETDEVVNESEAEVGEDSESSSNPSEGQHVSGGSSCAASGIAWMYAVGLAMLALRKRRK